MKTCEEVEVQLCAFLTSALDGNEWSDLHFGILILGGRPLGNHRLGGWVGPKAFWTLYRLEKPLIPAGNPTPTIAFPNRCTRWPVPKVNVYDRSVVIWYWQLSPNTYTFQAPQKAMEYARFAKCSTVRVLPCYWLQHKWMNERHRLPFRQSSNTQRDGSSISKQELRMSHQDADITMRYGQSYRGEFSRHSIGYIDKLINYVFNQTTN
jgi:hypothetical protein